MTVNQSTRENIKEVALKLLDYCRANNWAGYDPYDALNSKIFNYLPFLDFRWPRIIFTQALKRSPINFRPLLLIPKTENPKAIALFLMAFIKLRKLDLLENDNLIKVMIEKLINLRSPNNLINPTNPINSINPSNPYFCWGYSFPWQTRTILVPNGYPNLVCTAFAGNALLEAYEATGEERCLQMATSAGEYIVNELYWEEGSEAGFGYPLPSSREGVHNSNFLGAALLCRINKHNNEDKFLDPAMKVARYSAAKQREDGSWDYGEKSTQRWIDNFHTGYNLCALRAISEYAGTSEFEPHIRLGFEFYRNHFFREDGAPRYFHDRTYPFDIHSVAQSIITLLALRDLDPNSVTLAQNVFQWAMDNMWNDQGYFYYRGYPFLISKIPYMRWAEAWMLLALSTLLEHSYSVRRILSICNL